MAYNMQKAVRRGAHWLDRKRPGWWERVGLRMLDLSNCVECVLGQLFATPENNNGYSRFTDYFYRILTDSVSITDPPIIYLHWMSSHGFIIRGKEMLAGYPYTELTRLWRRAILHRRRAAREAKRTLSLHPVTGGSQIT